MTRALAQGLRALWRDWRAGELTVLVAALLVAVGSLTAIAFFTDRVAQGVAAQAAEVLAADLRLRSADEPSADYLVAARAAGLATARTLSFPSAVTAGGSPVLAAIHAVSDGYPLRGRVLVADTPTGERRVADGVPPPGEVWAAPGLLARLDVPVGTVVGVGSTELAITAVLDYRPDQSVGFVSLAPTLLMNLADIPATGLVQPGSRVRWSYLFAGDPGAVADFRAGLEPLLGEGERLQDLGDAGEQIGTAIDRAQRFLTLAALVSVLLAAVAVAMAARRYVARHLDAVALMKCLGASQGFIVRVSVVQLLTLALLTGLAGSLLGFLAQFGIASLLGSLVGRELPAPGVAPLVMGLVTATAILVGFALPAMLTLRRVPPVRVLRRDALPPRLSHWIAYGSAVAVVIAMLWWVMRDPGLLVMTALGVGVVLAALFLAGLVLVRTTGRLRGRVGVAWRYGLANIARRGRESTTQVVAFGLGVMVLLLLTVIRGDLLDTWRGSLPDDAPNNFLINIQPEERAGVVALFEAAGRPAPELAPLVRARLTQVDGVAASDVEPREPEAGGFLRREANLSFRDTLPESNRLTAGRWWSADPEEVEISVEADIARGLGLELGDTLTFSVAGEDVTGRVTSFRAVAWDSFEPNFYVLFSPSSLEGYPATYIGSVFVPRAERDVILDLMREYPSVSVIDLEAVITQVRTVMDRASLAVQYVFLFTLAAGVIVLMAAVQSTREERRYESAMLRTFGAPRGVVTRGLLAEFATLGVLAGLLAAAGALLIGRLLAEQVFRLDYTPALSLLLVGPLVGAGLVGLAGWLATRSVVTTPPVATLRAG